MRITYAKYEHTKIGYPGVVLKWSFNGLVHHDPYITIKGIMKGWGWEYQRKETSNIKAETDRFEAYVSQAFGDDASVQG